MSKRRWLMLGVLLAVSGAATAALLLFAHYTSDDYVRRRLLEAMSEALDAEVRIESASLSVLRGLEVRGLEISEGGEVGAGPVIALRYLRCDLDPWSLISGPIELSRLTADGANVALRVEADGRLNVASMVRPRGAAEPPLRVRLFPEGIAVNLEQLSLEYPGFFRDDTPRALRRVDVRIVPRADDLSVFQVQGDTADPLVRGASFAGWLEKRSGAPLDIFLEVSLPGIDVRRAGDAFFPAPEAAVLRRLEARGTAWGQVALSVEGGRPLHVIGTLSICDARVVLPLLPTPVDSLAVTVHFDPERVQTGPWVGRVAGGTTHGSFLLQVPRGTARRFRLHADIAGARLDEIASRLNEQYRDLRGKIDLRAELSGAWEDLDTTGGEIACDIKDAFLGEMPIFVGLLNVLDLRLPGKPVFDQGTAHAIVREGVAEIQELYLGSTTLDLTAKGRVLRDGDVDLIVVAGTSRRPGDDWFPVRVVKDVVHVVVGGLQETFMPPVHVTGTLREPRFRLLALEPIKRPLRHVTDVLDLVPTFGLFGGGGPEGTP